MTLSFSNILIPVDFSINTKLAIQKTLVLADHVKPTIHLLHVLKVPSVWGGYSMHGISYQPASEKKALVFETQIRLQVLKKLIESTLPDAIVVTYFISGDVVQNEIIRFASQFKPQLIIIGKHKHHSLLPFVKTVNPDFISKKTNCPVLTVRPGSVEDVPKTIILPVRNFIPKRKIELLFAVAKNNRPQVQLVIWEKKNEFNSNTRKAFFQTYQILSENLQFPVHDNIVRQRNFAKAILNQAKITGADMIILNPYEESKINCVSGIHINDLILPRSKLSVLSAKPYAMP